MIDIESSYIGYICEKLDNSKLKYHHCGIWFKLFLEDGTYSIDAEKNNNINEVVVFKGDNISWCRNRKEPIVFRGSLQAFENWLKERQ